MNTLSLECHRALEHGHACVGFEPASRSFGESRDTLLAAGHSISVLSEGPIEHADLRHGEAVLMKVALGRERGMANLTLDSYASSLVDPAVQGPQEAVRILPLGELLFTDVVLLKVDAQGYELHVLEGAKALFDNFVVSMVFVEWFFRGLEAANRDPKELVVFLHERGFVCFDVSTQTPYTLRAHHPWGLSAYEEKAREADEFGSDFFGFHDDLLCINHGK